MLGAGVCLAARGPARRGAGPPYGLVTLVLLRRSLAVITALSMTWSIAPGPHARGAARTLAYLAVFAGAVVAARLAPGTPPHGCSAACCSPPSAVAGLGARDSGVAGGPGGDGAGRPAGRAVRLLERARRDGRAGRARRAVAGRPARQRRSLPRALAFPALGVLMLTILLTQSRGALARRPCWRRSLWLAFVPLRLRSLPVLVPPASRWRPGRRLGAVARTPSPSHCSRSRPARPWRASSGCCSLRMMPLLLAAGTGGRRGRPRVAPTSLAVRRRVGIALVVVRLRGAARAAHLGRHERPRPGGTISDRVDELTERDRRAARGCRRGSARSPARAGGYWREASDVFEERPAAGTGAGTSASSRLPYRKNELSARHAHGFIPRPSPTSAWSAWPPRWRCWRPGWRPRPAPRASSRARPARDPTGPPSAIALGRWRSACSSSACTRCSTGPGSCPDRRRGARGRRLRGRARAAAAGGRRRGRGAAARARARLAMRRVLVSRALRLGGLAARGLGARQRPCFRAVDRTGPQRRRSRPPSARGHRPLFRRAAVPRAEVLTAGRPPHGAYRTLERAVIEHPRDPGPGCAWAPSSWRARPAAARDRDGAGRLPSRPPFARGEHAEEARPGRWRQGAGGPLRVRA